MSRLKFILKKKTAEDEEFLKSEYPAPQILKTVIVTDDAATVKKTVEDGVAVIGLERDGERLPGRFIIDSLDALDEDYIKQVHDISYRIPKTILETGRTVIRQCDPSADILPLIELYSKPHVTDYVEPLYPAEEEAAYQRDYFDHIYSFYDFGMWNVILKENGKLIGRCGLEYKELPTVTEDNADDWLELGYIIDPDYQGQGLGYETSKAAMDLAMSKGHRHFFVEIDPRNAVSFALAKKLGFHLISSSQNSQSVLIFS